MRFLAEIGGMNDEEKNVLEMFHELKDEAYICDMLGLDHKAYQTIEESVRCKMLLAVFECINAHMDNRKAEPF